MQFATDVAAIIRQKIRRYFRDTSSLGASSVTRFHQPLGEEASP